MGISGIVILTYNNWKLVFKLVNSILCEEMFDTIVVVDNCSTDDTWKHLQALYGDNNSITLIRSNKNEGYAAGNNLGAKKLLSNKDVDVIFFSNPDVILQRENVVTLINELRMGDFALLAPVMLTANGTIDKENYWDEPTYKTELLNCFYIYRCLTRQRREKKIDFTKRVMSVFAVTGSFFGIKRNVFECIDGFDQGTFLFCEENILGKKLKKNNLKTGILTTTTYIHDHSTIVDSSMNGIKKYKIQLNSHYYFARNYLCNSFVSLLVLRIAQMISYIELFLGKKIKSFVSIKGR